MPTLTSHVGIVSRDYNGKNYATIQRKGNTVREFTEELSSKGPDKNGRATVNRIQGFITPNYSNTTMPAPDVVIVKPDPVSQTPVIPSNGSLTIPPLGCVGATCYIRPSATNAEYFNVTFSKASDPGVVLKRCDHLDTTTYALFDPTEAGEYIVRCDAFSSTGDYITMSGPLTVMEGPTASLSSTSLRVGEPLTIEYTMPCAGSCQIRGMLDMGNSYLRSPETTLPASCSR